MTQPLHRKRIVAGALTLAAAVFACNVGFAGDEGDYDATTVITADKIKTDLFWIADDERGGRSVTSDGLNARRRRRSRLERLEEIAN